MKSIKVVLVLSILAVLSGTAAGAATVCPGTAYGEGVKLAEATPVSAILEHPERYTGKVVKIEGTVKDVCAKMGCWMEITGAGDGGELRVKVVDGVIVFPVAARGRRAIAEGTVESRDLSRDEFVAMQEHLAAEQGREFDPAAVGDGPFRHVQVKGTGAIVCEAGS